MQVFNWSTEKSQMLKQERDISFEEILTFIEAGKVIEVLQNPNYSNQKMFLINIDNYIYVVPFTESKEEIFLKTIYKSRKFTKEYIHREKKL